MKKRNYTQETVRKLQGSFGIEYTLAKRGAQKLRHLLNTEKSSSSREEREKYLVIELEKF